MEYTLPSRDTSTLNQSESALTHLAPTPCKAAGVFVGALPELAARVQVGQHQLHRRHLPLRMHVHRDAAPVVADGDRAIHVDRDFDLVAIAGQVLVNGVVQHLEDAVVQTRARPGRRYTFPGVCAPPPAPRACRFSTHRTSPARRGAPSHFSVTSTAFSSGIKSFGPGTLAVRFQVQKL